MVLGSLPMRVATSSCDHPRTWRSRFRLCCQDEFFSMRHLLSSILKRATQDTSLSSVSAIISEFRLCCKNANEAPNLLHADHQISVCRAYKRIGQSEPTPVTIVV